MNRSINHNETSPNMAKKLLELGMATKQSSLPAYLLDLVNIRISQMNSCAFCLDMHSKEAKIHGERELRVYHLPVFRESPLFTLKEKAVLEWAEVITHPTPHGVPTDVFMRVRELLTEQEMTDLTYSIGVINFYNRLNFAFPKAPGTLDTLFGLDKAGLK